MNNLLSYISWRGDIGFSQSPVNEVDIALFSEFLVPDFHGIIPPDPSGEPVSLQDAVEKYFVLHPDAGSELGVLEPQNTIPMIRAMALSERFRAVKLSGYVIHVDETRNEQFGALTAVLPDGLRILCFKPTDDTIVGWKEDCMLAVSDTVPAQKDALSYLEKAAGEDNAPLILSGQSKGGNLAAFAAMHTNETIKKRIRAVFNLDGPGFCTPFYEEDWYRDISDRIFTVRSQHSTVGTLMNEPGTVITVVSSVQGPSAHDPFTWEVLGTGFVRDPKGQSAQSRKFEQAMNDTLREMDREERTEFIEELFSILSAGGSRTLSDLRDFSLPKLGAIRTKLREGSAVQRFLNRVIGEYILPEGVKKITERRKAENNEE